MWSAVGLLHPACLPSSNSPHHDAEEQRRPAITRLIADGLLPDCYATDNGAAVTFFTTFHEAVTDRGSRAWLLRRLPDGSVQEGALATRPLGQGSDLPQ